MADEWDDPRFDRDWGTRQEVFAAFRAGWDIDLGPPPNKHALPPEDDPQLQHNGVPAPTDEERAQWANGGGQ